MSLVDGDHRFNCTTSTNSTCEVQDLECGAMYNFSVIASNSFCDSMPSTPIELETGMTKRYAHVWLRSWQNAVITSCIPLCFGYYWHCLIYLYFWSLKTMSLMGLTFSNESDIRFIYKIWLQTSSNLSEQGIWFCFAYCFDQSCCWRRASCRRVTNKGVTGDNNLASSLKLFLLRFQINTI